MSTLLTQITNYNNLYWAYQKLKNICRPGDIWFDELELAAFEADLGNQLEKIRIDVLGGKYCLQTIRPVAFPKSRDDNGPRTRQTFWVSIRDQVTWLAVTNIIGRYLDAKMPFWSYGNRLYISMFYGSEEDGNSGLQFGYYRNTTRYTFRKWSQSWPLYRRHINITSKFMTKSRRNALSDMDEQELKTLKNNEGLINHPLKADYLDINYWKSTKKNGLYWAGLDLEKFYPKLNLDKIKNNIIKYLPEKYISDEFKVLISSLLDFRLELMGWADEDLEKIQLLNSEHYHNLPTGLFVAGFLANLALLDVDEKVSKLLLINKNIAHFRYVDDHLILSTNFEDLLGWIEAYKKIIDDSEIGTTFNQNKTEPKELGAYFLGLENNSNDIKQLEETAKKQTSLDPDFPSPLMTKTLAKVSKIAGTPFNLLSPDEEKNLVADIEHLLITDFPDHELRKDTRVSFAARMLSSIIPQITVDSTESYRLHRNICLKTLVADSINKKLNKPGVGSRAELRKELKVINAEISENKSNLVNEERRLDKEELKLASRTVRLLLKAVSDNHDKVRLWARLIEFFFRSGSGKFELVTAELKKIKDKGETNELSTTFLHTIILQALTEQLFQIIHILSYSGSSHKKKKRAVEFAKNIFHKNVFNFFEKQSKNSPKIYEKSAYSLFLFGAGTVLTILNQHFLTNKERISEEPLLEYGFINFKSGTKIFIESSAYPAGVWIWWIYSKLPTTIGKQPYLWKETSSLLGNDYDIDMNVLMLYPRHLSANLLSKLDRVWMVRLSENEALWHEISKYNSDIDDELFNSLFSSVSKKSLKKANSISVEEWVDWTYNRNSINLSKDNKKMFFDPRLGEWMALEIIRQIAEEIKTKIETSFLEPEAIQFKYSSYIHPHNFKVPKKWIEELKDVTWEELSQLMGNGANCIHFRAIDERITDKRFVPHFGEEQNNENQSILHALGSILISLLSKNTELPNKWNPVGLQPAWMGLAKLKLKDIALSTYTRDIISGCYSNRNIETQFNLSLDQPDFIVASDTNNDPPDFRIIDDFIKYVEFALKKLKSQQLSVSAHQPRQLTPISIMQLKRSDYLNLIDQRDIE